MGGLGKGFGHMVRLNVHEARRVDLLQTAFSVTVVEDDFAALTGCAAYLAALAD